MARHLSLLRKKNLEDGSSSLAGCPDTQRERQNKARMIATFMLGGSEGKSTEASSLKFVEKRKSKQS